MLGVFCSVEEGLLPSWASRLIKEIQSLSKWPACKSPPPPGLVPYVPVLPSTLPNPDKRDSGCVRWLAAESFVSEFQPTLKKIRCMPVRAPCCPSQPEAKRVVMAAIPLAPLALVRWALSKALPQSGRVRVQFVG